MADQTNNPNNNPNRGNQSDGQSGDRNPNRDESGRVGTGTERERGTVQEPGQPDRNRQGGGSEGGSLGGSQGGSQGGQMDRNRSGV
jgi:hypothetical protein